MKIRAVLQLAPRISAALVVGASLLLPGMAFAVTQPRDYDGNAVKYGGTYTKVEWFNALYQGDGRNSAANLQHVYLKENRGITESNFASYETVDGVVFRDGHVEVNGKTVATGAVSVGRDYLNGSWKDGSLWARPTSVSFKSNSIPAFVSMQGGVFHYAIIKSCGNPVKAIPVPQKPTPAPTPKLTPAPTPTPVAPICKKLEVTRVDATNKPTLFRFTLTPTTTTGVTGYRFTFSDDSTPVDTNADTPYIDREVTGYLKVYGYVKTRNGTTDKVEACSAAVTVTTSPSPSPSVAPTPTPSGQVLGVSLPATGPEAALGGAVGLSAIGMTARAYIRSRKSVLDALRNKIIRH